MTHSQSRSAVTTAQFQYRTPFRLAVIAVLAVLLSLSAQAAPPEGKGHKDKAGHKGRPDAAVSAGHHSGGGAADSLRRAGITVDVVRQIAVQHQATGYASLPPGIRKNLARGKPLPPGIAKKAVPQGVLDRLPHYAGYEWEAVGSDLVLKRIAGAVIADILVGVFN